MAKSYSRKILAQISLPIDNTWAKCITPSVGFEPASPSSLGRRIIHYGLQKLLKEKEEKGTVPNEGQGGLMRDEGRKTMDEKEL